MEFKVENCEENIAMFVLDVNMQKSGTYSYGLRFYPKKKIWFTDRISDM